jgi:hypothetical protein
MPADIIDALARENEIGGSGGSFDCLNPLGLFLRTSIVHTVYMPYSECLSTRLNTQAG